MQSTQPCPHKEHKVQFYNSESFLVDRIWEHIEPALRSGDAAIVIATAPHLKLLEQTYDPARLDELNCISHRAGYMALDAYELLQVILIDGWPDEARFAELFGGLVDRLGEGGKRNVFAYGEMVALLCAEGRTQAAIRLEQLWNDLGTRVDFSLLCGYPMEAFFRTGEDSSFASVCQQHSHVHAEQGTAGSLESDDLRISASLQQKALALEAEVARRKEIERSLQLREMELAEMNRRKDEFLAMLGHELRNPLAPISNALELMRIRPDDAQQTFRCRETIARQVKLMTRLVDDLLDITRITRGNIKLTRERVALNQIIERAIETARPLIDNRRHRIVLNLPAEEIFLSADPFRLAQAVANLLQNAAKYTDDGGRITIAAHRSGGMLTLAISDTGIGIETDDRERIFDLFVQQAHSRDMGHGGLGIGLTLVRTLVQMHGGSIRVHSDGPGTGSEFIIDLPAAPSCGASDFPSAAAGRDTLHVHPRRILIVDDNIDAAESLGEYLNAGGHLVDIAHDGASAIKLAASARPEIVILDIGMPDMNGYQVAQRLRDDVGLKSATLVALTGYAQEHDRMSSANAGFDHHFAKPLDIARLAAVLREGRDISAPDSSAALATNDAAGVHELTLKPWPTTDAPTSARETSVLEEPANMAKRNVHRE